MNPIALRRHRNLSVLFAAVFFTVPNEAAALQGRLVRATLTAVISPDAQSTTVQMRYTLRPGGETRVPIAIVLFDSTRVESIQAGSPSFPVLTIDGLNTSTSRPAGTVLLGAAEAASDEVEIGVLYTIVWRRPASMRRVQIPVLAVTWPPADALPGTFIGTITTTVGTAAWDATPSVMRLIAESPESRTYEVDLQVVPAAISFDLVVGNERRVSAAALLDGAVLVLLMAFSWLGWKHFRQEN